MSRQNRRLFHFFLLEVGSYLNPTIVYFVKIQRLFSSENRELFLSVKSKKSYKAKFILMPSSINVIVDSNIYQTWLNHKWELYQPAIKEGLTIKKAPRQ